MEKNAKYIQGGGARKEGKAYVGKFRELSKQELAIPTSFETLVPFLLYQFLTLRRFEKQHTSLGRQMRQRKRDELNAEHLPTDIPRKESLSPGPTLPHSSASCPREHHRSSSDSPGHYSVPRRRK